MLSLLKLDIHTIIVMLFTGNFAVVILLLTYRSSVSEKRSYMYFIYGRVMQCAAWPLLALRGDIPDIISADAGNTLLIAGFALEALAMSIAEKSGNLYEKIYAPIAAAGILCFWLLASTPGMRVGIASTVVLLLFSVASVAVLKNSSGSLLKKAMGIFYLIFCAMLAARAYLGFASHGGFSLMSPHVVQTLNFMPLYIMMLAGGLGFLLTHKEQEDIQLSENEEKYRTLVQKSNEGIIIMQDDLCVFANPRMCEMVGISHDKLIGEKFPKFIYPDDLDFVLSNYKSRIDNQETPDSYDFRILRPDGGIVWMFISAKMITWNGRAAVLAMLTDISARKQMESEKERIIAELQSALSETGTRSDMLPVCASCKKIRGENNTWEQIEKYFTEHYGIEFSHSLCPDCAARLYPEYKNRF